MVSKNIDDDPYTYDYLNGLRQPGEQPLMMVTYPDDNSVTTEHQAEYLDAPTM